MICCSCSIQLLESVEPAQYLVNDVAGERLTQELSDAAVCSHPVILGHSLQPLPTCLLADVAQHCHRHGEIGDGSDPAWTASGAVGLIERSYAFPAAAEFYEQHAELLVG